MFKKKQRNYENDSENYEKNLKIVKKIITKYFSNANVKKVGICRTFQNYFKHTEKSKKMPKLRNKNKDRDGAYSNFKNIGRF